MSRLGTLVATTLVVIAAGGGYYYYTHQTAADAGKAPAAHKERAVAVEVAKAARQPMPVNLDAVGTVVPISTVSIYSQVDGMITAVHFTDGSEVKEGDILYSLDDQAVRGQIAQAQANLQQYEAQQTYAAKEEERFKNLAEQKFSSEASLDQYVSQAAVAGAQVAAAKAAIEILKVDLDHHTIRAPFSGRIGISNAHVGTVVKADDTSSPLVTLNQMHPIDVSVPIPQRHLAALRAAVLAGPVSVSAQPVGETAAETGKVSTLDNTVDTATGTIGVRARFDNPDEKLWPGRTVGVKIALEVQDDAVTVPAEAVQTGRTGPYVFVVSEGKAKVQPVTVAREVSGLAVIGNGLAGGETVVTVGQLRLNDGMPVEVHPSTPVAGDPARSGPAT